MSKSTSKIARLAKAARFVLVCAQVATVVLRVRSAYRASLVPPPLEPLRPKPLPNSLRDWLYARLATIVSEPIEGRRLRPEFIEAYRRIGTQGFQADVTDVLGLQTESGDEHRLKQALTSFAHAQAEIAACDQGRKIDGWSERCEQHLSDMWHWLEVDVMGS